MIDTGPLCPKNRVAGEVLAYLHSIGARLYGELVGIARYVFHVIFWSADTCYLQDLFVAEVARGRGGKVASLHGFIRYDHLLSTT